MSGPYRLQHASTLVATSSACGCCDGVSVDVPLAVANRPGRSSLNYRIGTYAAFFNSLLARVATYGVPLPGPGGTQRVADAPPDRLSRLLPGTSLVTPAEAQQLLPARLLRDLLTTREKSDPSIALFDAWAVLADVLTFYQERLANEGFLRTAREDRSLYELSRLVGYRPRPGVSASVYLAFAVDDPAAPPVGGLPGVGTSNPAAAEILIPAGTAARSTPKPGQQEEPQTFETSHDLLARKEWSEIRPRLTRPLEIDEAKAKSLTTLLIRGVGNRLSPGDYLGIRFSTGQSNQVTWKVALYQVIGVEEITDPQKLLDGKPVTRVDFVVVTNPVKVKGQRLEKSIFVFRSRANLFGWNARPTALNVSAFKSRAKQMVKFEGNSEQTFDTNIDGVLREFYFTPLTGHETEFSTPPEPKSDSSNHLYLDGSFTISAGSIVAVAIVDGATAPLSPFSVTSSYVQPRTAYGLSGNATVVDVGAVWWTNGALNFEAIRTTSVLCNAEPLELAEVAITDPVGSDTIEIDREGAALLSGRHVIVAGNTANNSDGNVQAEVAVVIPPSTDRTSGKPSEDTITFSTPLKYSYRRDSVRIYANVVEATHGETQRETLGSGNGAVAFQRFTLRRPDISQLPAPTTLGTESTLRVRVSDVLWPEREGGFVDAEPQTEGYITLTDDQQRLAVVFGDGVHGARLPTGLENVRATYRAGLGRKGNVDAGQIDQPLGAPLGVKKVINPLRAQGGTDPEPASKLREHVPLAATALDRLVSVADYADFARSYAGIGKATSERVNGTVYVTIAAPEPAPFSDDNPVKRNLEQAMRRFGDPDQQFELVDYERIELKISANVRIAPARQWEQVEPVIRHTLLTVFGYDQAELGKSVRYSDVIVTIQSCEGVVFVDLDVPSRPSGSTICCPHAPQVRDKRRDSLQYLSDMSPDDLKLKQLP